MSAQHVRDEGEEIDESSLETLVQRTTDVYTALIARELPNRDAEFNCGRSYLEADRADLAEEVFRRLIEAGYKPTESRFQLCRALAAQSLYVEARLELAKLLEDDPEHVEAIEFAKEFEETVAKEGKLFIYGLLGFGALICLFLAFRKGTQHQPSLAP